MKSIKIISAALMTVGLFTFAEEKSISIKELPETIIKAAQESVKGIDLVSAEQMTKEGKVIGYELEGKADNKGYEIKISANGEVNNIDIETEIPLHLSEIPAAVVKQAESRVPGLKITEANATPKGKTFLYEIEGTLQGKEFEMQIDADGNLRKFEKEDDKAELAVEN